MLAKVKCFAISGIVGYPLDIEVDINSGIPAYETVGLPDTAVKESKERVRSGIKNRGYQFPIKKIVINLAPADTKKEGASFDLPIALAILIASEQFVSIDYKDYIIIGELSLDGEVKPVKGILPILISGLQCGYTKYIIPYENAEEASYIEGIDAYPVRNLNEAVELLTQSDRRPAKVCYRPYASIIGNSKFGLDFNEVKGQFVAKRALEISVSGGHNILMIGAPGSGKTMLAKCVPSIMPYMTFEEALEVTKVHSVAGILDKSKGVVNVRPFRSPHHTATSISLIGGGAKSKPGEISLAHNGVLFLDELPEYNVKTLETLRQPLEDGIITVTRIHQTAEYPAQFMLIASMNPCPCGNYGSKTLQCRCTPMQIHKYLSKLSGPLMDRIDLQVEVDNVTYDELRGGETSGDSSNVIRDRVIRAREIQTKRYAGTEVHTNSRMSNSMIKDYCKISSESERLLESAFKKLDLSARGISRILKVARTIADIEGKNDISTSHIFEAVSYRSIDKKYKV